MTLLDQAIKAAQIADPHFVLARRPKIAEEALHFTLYQDGRGQALFIFVTSRIAPSETIPRWEALKPVERCAWEIFAGTARAIHRAECEEAAKAAKPARRLPVPRWMIGDDDELVPGMGDRVSYLPRDRRISGRQQPALLQEAAGEPEAQPAQPQRAKGRRRG